MTAPIIVVGAGGHARVLISLLRALHRHILGILLQDLTLIGQTIWGVPVIGSDDDVDQYSPNAIELVNAIGSVSSTRKRRIIYEKYKNNGYSFSTIVHPKATIIEDVKLSEGVQIMAGAIIQTGCFIDNNTIINTGAIVDHDCIIGEHVHVAPGVVLSGGVHIGTSAHIGTAATVIEGIKIGNEAIIGAGSVVIRDIPDSKLAVGVPARYR